MISREAYLLELFIAKFLRYGVLLAGALMLAGWLTQISFSSDIFSQFQTYREVTLANALEQAWTNRSWGLLASYGGLGLLISLPVVRVLVTFAVFIRRRDFAMATLAAIVILGLTISVVLGFEI